MADMFEVCSYLKNYFLSDYVNYTDIYKGTFGITNGGITLPDSIVTGQYFRIKGSKLNDGVYKNTTQGLAPLTAEEFTGQIWAMYVPRAFETLVNDIDAWKAKYYSVGNANMSPFTSENVSGVYSYSKGSSSGSNGGTSVSWQDVFKSRLSSYRRINEL